MLDMVVDRRELKDTLTRVLAFGGSTPRPPAPKPAPAPDTPAEPDAQA
jgi:hypothetical protein